MGPDLKAAAPLVLIGAGKMGGAMLSAWLGKGLDPAGVRVIDPGLDDARRRDLERTGVGVADKVSDGPCKDPAKILVLAVKPQIMKAVLAEVAGIAGPDTVVISIAAGIAMKTLAAAFAEGQGIVRIMPNMPAQVGAGMAVAFANDALNADDRALVDALMAATGATAWIGDEALMDAVTAVSGSGPAYVFYLAECLAAAGRAAGLDEALAEKLARQTVVGGGALLDAASEPAAVLRENVTSPGGTTAAALAVLMGDDGLKLLLEKAVAAARARSIELG
ncbi:MAG: pyrroline-5-carboxylate reductase [Alphaproteobacteria bacterium]|nr:MAG: pyrroline-5-carboxylate reductase [Alphaproteobacteria bacterium]